ncbi:hypothetical protein [Micromonospora sp. NPDC005173]|uniref:hypothetical protein n=1 Tax=Micromonospora sp. NPDC005173 TaxID=3157165 RepID=UPI0033BB172A
MLDALVSAATALATPLAPLITGGCTLAGVVLTQRFAQRQQAAAQRSAAVERAEAVTTELVTAAAELHLALVTDNPRWNSWQPRLLALGQSALEFFAGREAGGLAHGSARASRVVLDWHGQSAAAGAGLVRDPYLRLITAISRAALLAEKEVVQAAMQTSEAAAAVMSAYGQDNLYRPRAAKAARTAAEAALQEAMAHLIATMQNHLHPVPSKPLTGWRRPLRLLRRPGSRTDARG